MIKEKIKSKLRLFLGITHLEQELKRDLEEKIEYKIKGEFGQIISEKLSAKSEHDKAELLELRRYLYEEMSARFAENCVAQQNIFNQIIATENNLDNRALIEKILREFNYSSLELLRVNNSTKAGTKILLIGFYGADNLGDELMMQEILNRFPKERLNDITVVLCDNEGYDYAHLPAVNFLHMPKNRFDFNVLAEEFDVLVWGGGALLDDCLYEDGSVCLNNMLVDLSMRFVAFDKPIYALGLSTNFELTNYNYIEKLKIICEKSKCFSVRDKYSYELLKSHGIENVTRIEDPVFYEDFDSLRVEQDKQSDTVKIGIIWVCYPETKEKFKILIDKIDEKFKEEKYEICLIPFYDYVNIDTKYFNETVDILPQKDKIKIMSYENTFKGLISCIDSMDYTVSLRYHGILVCGMLGKKSLDICYDIHRHYPNKVKYLSEIFGMEGKILNYSEIDENTNIEFSLPNTVIDLQNEKDIGVIVKQICSENKQMRE